MPPRRDIGPKLLRRPSHVVGTGDIRQRCAALCEIKADINGNPRKLMNLSELGDTSMNKVILDFIKNIEYPFMGKD
jgi:hypothetical protein